MKTKLTLRVMTALMTVVMLLSALPMSAFAAIPNWEDNNVVFDGTSFGTNGYYNVISKKDYVLVPGAAVESEIVLNNATGTRRQVLHIIEVDPSNPDVSIVPGYYQIDKDLSWDTEITGIGHDDTNPNWSHKELTKMAQYYEANLGYNIVGGMNTDLYYNTYGPRVLVYNGKKLGGAGSIEVSTRDGKAPDADGLLDPTSSVLYVFKDAEGNISCDVKAYSAADLDKYLADGTLLHAVGVSFAMVVKDGKLVNTSEVRGNDDAARSMVGVKEDGTLVLCMNDGRSANNSVGFSSYEEGEAMLALGCKWAANCDGGGSSTFLTKRVGEETFTMRSVPCDGAQRPTAHGIFVASNVGPTGELDVVNVESDYDIFAPKTAYSFGAEAIDTHGYAMAMPADAAWALSDASFGTIENGKFVSSGTKGTVDVQVLSGGKVVGSKTITVADPEVFKLSAASTVVPYSTADKVRTITLPIVALIGEANVYVDTNAVTVTSSNEKAGTLDGFNFTATDDTSITGVDVTVRYGDTTLTYAIAFGKGSEVIFDFEDGDKAGFMGFEEAKKWSQENNVNNTLVGNNPLAGQFNEYLSSTTFTATAEQGGQVRNGEYALAWRLDNTDAAFAGWSYNVLFNTGDRVVLRDVDNGMNATTLGMWVYIPEGAPGLAFQAQVFVRNSAGKTGSGQMDFKFVSAATGKLTNLNSATEADIPESRWVYMSADISGYVYVSTLDPHGTADNTRSPSFTRTYVKPTTPAELTFYIDDITLDYSSAVDDRVLPVISNPAYSTSDTAFDLENGTAITGNKVAFSAKVSDNAALDITSGKISVDGVSVKVDVIGGAIYTAEDVTLAAGDHTVTFEISDEMGNPAKITRSFTVAGDAVVELSGHNESGEAPKAQSVYYVDINVADLSKVTRLEAQLKLHNANTWETEGTVVANGFKADLSYNSVSELLTVTVELEDAIKARTAGQTLVSIPVRVWTYDRFNYVTGEYIPVGEMGNKPAVNVICRMIYGNVTLSDKTSSPVGGSINVATELTTITSPYHEHDAELTVLNKEATTTEIGYENRTYCETCKSVVDWGTIIPKVEITHNYAIVDGKFVCQDEGCGHVYESGTGVFEMNGDLYYSIAGKLVTGWQDVGEGKRCYAHSSYKLAVGEATINGIKYEFDEMGGTYGAWVEDENGFKYSYGPDFYSCAKAANPHANAVWATINGETYAFDRNGYRHENISVLVESNNPAVLYEFTAEGVLIGEYETDHSGIFVCNNGTTYLENGTPIRAGLVKEDGYYYYINSGFRAVTGSYEITRVNGLLPEGVYEFDEAGRMLNPPALLNGPQENGDFYIDGVKQSAYKIVKYEGDYYYIYNYNKYATDLTIFLTADQLKGTDFEPGVFIFGSDGKMVVKDGPDADGYFYRDGVKQLAYQVVEYEGDYYFIYNYNKYATDLTIFLTADLLKGTNFEPGIFIFDSDGKMVIKNGPDADGYFYRDGVKQLAYQMVEYEGDYYFIYNYNKYATDLTIFLTADLLKGTDFEPGMFIFGSDGKMVVKDGPDADGYFYRDGVKQLAYQMVEYEGDYYFIYNYNKYATDLTIFLTADLLKGTDFEPGMFIFGSDGKMVVKDGPDADGYFYRDGVKQLAYQMVEYEGDYYFIYNYNKYATDLTIFLTADLLKGTNFEPGNFTFGSDGKMVVKNGPDADGYFYLNGVKQLAYQLIKFEDNWYFIYNYNKYLVNANMVYLGSQRVEGTDLKPWYYSFGPDGKMIGYTPGVLNGRDIGAVPFLTTTEGYDIKEGLLIRGSELDGAELGVSQAEGAAYLEKKYSIKTEIDLRGPLVNAKDMFSNSVTHKYYTMVFYKDAFTDEGKAVVKDIFTELANPDNYPIYIHCAHGIDRVGTVAYILEAVLGVKENAIGNEYMLSVGAYGEKYLEVKNGINTYKGATFRDRAEAYLLDCGITMEQIETLREIYLEK